jgi:hypothetical protein
MGLLVAGSSQDSSGVLFGTCSSLNRANGCVFALVVNPPVSITPVTGISPAGISVFWPSWAAGFVLQTSTNQVSGPWSNVTNGIPISGLQLPQATNGNTFFRLIAPQ